MTCGELSTRAAGLAALADGDPDRQAAELHAEGCTDCAASLDEGVRLVGWIDALPGLPPMSDALLDRVCAAMNAQDRQKASSAWGWLPVVGAALAGFGLGLTNGIEGRDWSWAVVLLVAACGVMVLSGRVRHAWAATIVLSLVAAAGRMEAHAGGIHPSPHCLNRLIVAAVAPLVVALFMSARGLLPVRGRAAFASVAAAGALAGQAALLLTCDLTVPAHLFVVHVGAVALAALSGALAGSHPRFAPAA